MKTKQLLNERERLIQLMLFYKNDKNDYKLYITCIKSLNEALKAKKRYNKNEQYEFLIDLVLRENTIKNRERLKTKYIELKRNL